MSQALYRKYRSRNLDEVLGQDHVTNILRRALEKGRIAHAYLLTGPRGTGKTSVARILAHEINQLPYKSESTHLDIIEIDAASNNSVDDIRALREKARIAPVSAKYKVYIIDEVHMLSKSAFNALLKTLEEPPSHVVFILATTDADKLPSTILSRVQQYFFRPISTQTIAEHLVKIAKSEGFKLEKDAAELIARQSRGGFRDSISLLDQLSSLASEKESLKLSHVAGSLGLSGDDTIDKLIESYDSGDTGATLKTLNELEEQGIDPVIVTQQLLAELRLRLTERPDYTSLIQALIEVVKSPHPDLKLITALLPKTEVAPVKKVTARPVTAKKAEMISEPEPKYQPEPKKEEEAAEPEAKKAENEEPQPKPEKTTAPEASKPAPSNFDWDKLLEAANQQSLGLFSILKLCGFDYQNGKLTVYAGRVFNKKKLEDAKNRPSLAKAIQNSQGAEVEIIIKSGARPPRDEKLAAVADMMGGEEVSLEEIS